MKVKLAVALVVLILFSALYSKADTLQLGIPGAPNQITLSIIVIPDGSTITSETYFPPGTRATGDSMVNFSFADGTGQADGDTNDGDEGTISFTIPVSSLTFDWLSSSILTVEGVGSPLVLIRVLAFKVATSTLA
jgi:hypothetical protein